MPKYMHDSKSQDNKSWGIGHVLFAIKKVCRISHSACRSLRLMAFQLKQEQDKTDNPNGPVFCPENDVCFLICCRYLSAL